MTSTLERAIRAAVVLGWLSLCAFGCAETQEVRPPVSPEEAADPDVSDHADLRVYLNEYPLIYDDPALFALDVFFENRGAHTLIILPTLIRRHYSPMDESGLVSYVPRDEPVPATWDGAFTLRPRETKVVTLAGMEDGDGAWELEQGFYRLSVRYVVPEDMTHNGTPRAGEAELEEGVLWVGEQESQELTVRYEPPSASP